MSKVGNYFWVGLASCFYLSYGPATGARLIQSVFKKQILTQKKWTGAGFVGSVWGALTYLFLPVSVSNSLWAIGGGILFAVLVSHMAEKALQNHDDSRIVIDEWIGVWIALYGLTPVVGWPVVCAFFLFRVFDVFKGPWGQALQKLPGGWGITLDDVAAGLIANVLTRLVQNFL